MKIKNRWLLSCIAMASVGFNSVECRVPYAVAKAYLPYLLEAVGIVDEERKERDEKNKNNNGNNVNETKSENIENGKIVDEASQKEDEENKKKPNVNEIKSENIENEKIVDEASQKEDEENKKNPNVNEIKSENIENEKKEQAILDLIYTDEGQYKFRAWVVRNILPDIIKDGYKERDLNDKNENSKVKKFCSCFFNTENIINISTTGKCADKIGTSIIKTDNALGTMIEEIKKYKKTGKMIEVPIKSNKMKKGTKLEDAKITKHYQDLKKYLLSEDNDLATVIISTVYLLMVCDNEEQLNEIITLLKWAKAPNKENIEDEVNVSEKKQITETFNQTSLNNANEIEYSCRPMPGCLLQIKEEKKIMEGKEVKQPTYEGDCVENTVRHLTKIALIDKTGNNNESEKSNENNIIIENGSLKTLKDELLSKSQSGIMSLKDHIKWQVDYLEKIINKYSYEDNKENHNNKQNVKNNNNDIIYHYEVKAGVFNVCLLMDMIKNEIVDANSKHPQKYKRYDAGNGYKRYITFTTKDEEDEEAKEKLENALNEIYRTVCNCEKKSQRFEVKISTVPKGLENDNGELENFLRGNNDDKYKSIKEKLEKENPVLAKVIDDYVMWNNCNKNKDKLFFDKIIEIKDSVFERIYVIGINFDKHVEIIRVLDMKKIK